MTTTTGTAVVTVTDDTFEELVLHGPLPVLLEFWAPGADRAGSSPRSWSRSPARRPDG